MSSSQNAFDSAATSTNKQGVAGAISALNFNVRSKIIANAFGIARNTPKKLLKGKTKICCY
jgi:hypothetical protein